MPGAPADESGPEVDLEVRRGDQRDVPHEPPTGEPLVHLELAGLEYWIVGNASGYVARFPSLCEFEIAADRRRITVHLAPKADPELVSLLLTGNLIAFVLGVGGETVLHASAVELSGDAIAIVGGPGSGKSTVAAELCLAGARLVTDDTLRVGIEDGTAYCHRGTSELRLRASAGALAERFPKETRRLSTDGRISVQVPDGSDPRPPIGAVIAPSIYRGAAKAKVSRLKPGDGFVRLVANPRLIGWVPPHGLSAQFGVLAELASAVPILDAFVPATGRFGAPLRRELTLAARRSRTA